MNAQSGNPLTIRVGILDVNPCALSKVIQEPTRLSGGAAVRAVLSSA